MVIHVTLLAEEWTQSARGGTLSTFNRQLGIHLAQHPDVKVGLLIPKCSLEDKQDAEEYHINVVEPEEFPGRDPVDWLAFPPIGFSTDFVIGHDVKLGWQGKAIKHHLPGCKWIHMVHSNAEEMGMHKNFSGAISTGQMEHEDQIKLCENADMVVAIGPKLKDSFSSSLSFSGKEIFNLTPGMFDGFCDLCKDLNFQDRRTFHLLIFGRGDAEDFKLKGFDVAAKAVAALDDNTYHLIVVGAPDGMQEELATKLCSHGISRNQLVVRRFTKDRIKQLSDLFYEVDLLLMPSATEAFGLAALEALSAGLPVLVTSNSGLAEALSKVPLGSHCIVDSDADWAKEIKKARKQLEIRQEEAKMLCERYKEKYSWKEQCAALVEKMMNMHPDVAQDTPKKSLTKDGSSSSGQKRHKDTAENIHEDSVRKESPPAPKRLKGSPVDPEEERASSAVNPEEKRDSAQGTQKKSLKKDVVLYHALKRHRDASQGPVPAKRMKTQPKFSIQGSEKQKGASKGTSTKRTAQPKAANQGSKKQKVEVKEGVPKDEELEGLAIDIGDDWKRLGRRLKVTDQLEAINKRYDALSEKGYQMLKHWKQKNGAKANYQSLSVALKHKLVQRKDLAEKYCYKRR